MNRRLCALLGPILILIPTMVQAAEGYPTFSSMFPKAFNFFLLAALLYFILKKYVIAFFKGRTERIESELSAARKAQEEAQRKAAEYEEKYRTVTDELAKLKETMRISALDEKKRFWLNPRRWRIKWWPTPSLPLRLSSPKLRRKSVSWFLKVPSPSPGISSRTPWTVPRMKSWSRNMSVV